MPLNKVTKPIYIYIYIYTYISNSVKINQTVPLLLVYKNDFGIK